MRGGFKDWFERSDSSWLGKKLPRMARDWLDRRPLECYQNDLKFGDDDLIRWQKILEVGSGNKQLFAIEVEEKFPGVEVVPIDPLLAADPQQFDSLFYAGKSRLSPDFHGKAIAADVLHLPFADGSFGAVLAMWSVPQYLRTRYRFRSNYEKAVTQMAKEFIRVLRVGGEARVYPVILEEVQVINSTLGDLKKLVKIEYRPETDAKGDKRNWGLLIIRRVA